MLVHKPPFYLAYERRDRNQFKRLKIPSGAEPQHAKNHRSSKGVWLVNFKTPSPFHLSGDDITEEALCFGWIDSLPRAVDAKRSMLYVAPRKPKSAWSHLNKTRAERMIVQKKMTSAGLAKIDAAKKDGSWDFLVDVQANVIPPDLGRALKGTPRAMEHFEKFPPSSKRIILEWIKMAKKSETRAKRIEETARLAAKNIRANHYRQ